MRLTFTNGRPMARNLRQMGDAAGVVLGKAVLVGGAIIRQRAATLARARKGPRRRPRTVQLADTIKVSIDEQTRAYVRGAVFTKSKIAHFVEFGHQQIPRGKGRKTIADSVRVKRAVGVRWRVTRRTRKDGTVVTKTVLVTRKRSFVTGVRGQMRRALIERRKAGSTGFVAPRPFLRPAFDENRELVIRRMAEVIGKGVEQHWRKLAQQTPARAVA